MNYSPIEVADLEAQINHHYLPPILFDLGFTYP